MSAVHVVCFGSLVAGDDGFGIHVLQRLRARAVPDGVSVFDGGIAGFSALTHFEGCDAVIVVDALALEHGEGHLQRFELDLRAAPDVSRPLSQHGLDLTHLVGVLPIVFEGRAMPRVMVVGAEASPARMGFSMELSAPLRAAVDPAADGVLQCAAALLRDANDGAWRGPMDDRTEGVATGFA